MLRFNPFTKQLDFVGSGATTALDNLASVAINTSLISDTDSTYNLGSTSKYWANTYTDRLYLNSTAYLDGGTAGNVTINGNGGATGVITATDSTNSTATQMMTLLTSSLNNAITYINFGKALSTNNYGRIFFTHSSDGSANNSIALSVGGGSAQIKIFNSSIQHTGSLYPSADSANELGLSTRYYSNTYTDRLYLNATADFNGSVAGTANLTGFLGIAATSGAATHSLTLGSAATGIAHYNTSDQTTNYERVRSYWSGNVYRVGALEIGGTGTTRDVRFGNTTTYLNIFGPNYGLGFVAGNSGVASGYNASFSGTLSASSGTQYALTQTTTISQSGTAGYTAFFIDVTESTTGSGGKLLIDAQVGGAARFSVDNNGNIRAVGLLNTASFNNARIQPLNAGTKIDRNIADANTTLIIDQVHASSTGKILDLQAGGVSKVSVSQNGVLMPVQATTASAPTYIKGGIYFDTTLNKLRIGGATGWETCTSV